jgi:hypothetical protein
MDSSVKGNQMSIQMLRAAYDRIDRIDPDSPNYKNLCDFLDRQTTEYLEVIADAKVKFVSGLARNRINRRKLQKNQ